MLRLIVVLLAAALAVSTAQAAKMYKWVDKNGVTHFSTRPPPSKNADHTKLKGGSLLRPHESIESQELAKVNRVNLGGSDWDGCASSLCQLVQELDPGCETSYCSRAKSFSESCTSAACQSKRLVFESDVRKRIEQRDALRRQQAINANETPVPPASESQD